MLLITSFFKPSDPTPRTPNHSSNQVSVPLTLHAGAGGSPSSSSTSITLPPLPVELVAQIIKESRREDLPAVHATCRMFKEIARSPLFEDLVYFSVHGIESSLMSVAQTPELADLVRSLHVCIQFVPPEQPQQVDEIVGIVAIALGHFPKLESFTFEQPNDREIALSNVLELAILSHPSLQTLSYELWDSPLTPYNFSFKRTTRAHPLTIDEISYSEDPTGLSPSWFSTILAYISHHQPHVRSLYLTSIQLDGPLPLLLSNPIPGLVSFTITYDQFSPPPAIITETTWLSFFLQSHPLLRALRFYKDEDDGGDDEDDDQLGNIRLPWISFSWVQGLEGLSDNTLVNWDVLGGITDLNIGWSKGEERAVVLFQLETAYADDASPLLSTSMIDGLATALPKLQELKIYGRYTTPGLAQTIAALAGFKSLSELVFASNILGEGDANICYHQADLILQELDRDAEDSTLSLILRPGLIAGSPIAIPLTQSDRDFLRDRLLTSKVHHRRSMAQFVARFQGAWRTLLEGSPSLRNVRWDLFAGPYYQGMLKVESWAELNESVTTGSSSTLGRVACFCEEEEEVDLDEFDWMEWFADAKPLFEQQPDFVPISTLDRFFPPSS